MATAEHLVTFIRHGSTHKFETGELLRDDPLGALGKAEADALAPLTKEMGDVCMVVVSPLQRAMETAVRAFASRPDIRFVVHPALREFNMLQTEREPLNLRHQGQTLRVLKDKFGNPNNPDLYRPNIEWPDVADDAEWWEPHGDFVETRASTVPTAYARAQSTALAIWHTAHAAAPRRIAVVAHENLYRSMIGCLTMPTAAVMHTFLSPPITSSQSATVVATQQATRRFLLEGVLPGTVGGPGPDSARPPPHVCDVADSDSAANLAATHTVHAYVVLGCSDTAVAENRLRHAMRLLRLHATAVLVLVCSVAELHHAWSFMEAELRAARMPFAEYSGLIARIILDANSMTTIDNALFAIQRLQVAVGLGMLSSRHVHVHLVTSDWHMPRSLVIFMQSAAQLAASAWLYTTPAAAGTPYSALAKYNDKHLCDAMYHLHYFHGNGSTDGLLRRIIAVGGMRSLLALGRNARYWARKHLTRMQGVPLSEVASWSCAEVVQVLRSVGADAAKELGARAKVFDLCSAAHFPPGLHGAVFPLAHMPLNTKGSNALHFAASKGMEALCLDLLFFFGCHAGTPNNEGTTPVEFARKNGFEDLAALLQDAACEQSELDGE